MSFVSSVDREVLCKIYMSSDLGISLVDVVLRVMWKISGFNLINSSLIPILQPLHVLLALSETDLEEWQRCLMMMSLRI